MAGSKDGVGRTAGRRHRPQDFNNLLTVISGSGGISLAALPPDHSSRGHLLEVADAAQSAGRSDTAICSAFSRKEIIAPSVLDLNEVLRRAEQDDPPLLIEARYRGF